MKIIKRRVSMIVHSENYGCQIGTGACRNLCPVQIHPGGFPAALENQILCGRCPQEFGAITATHIPQTGSGNLIPSFCQKGDQSIISTGSICNHLRMLPIFSFFCVVKHHRWYRSAANRAYYAIFHAMRAVLALDGVDMKHHSGIISEFRKGISKPACLTPACPG